MTAGSSDSADLHVSQLSKSFPTPAGSLDVLRQVDLQLAGGESLAVVGPSGCGKSTLLHILGTLERPTSGAVLLGKTNPFELDELAVARFRNEQIGFIFQDHHLLPQLSVWENLLIPALAAGKTTTPYHDRARELLEQVGLDDRVDHRPSELSGGQRQRVAVARALLLRPTLVLADEPTGNLDRSTGATITELLLDLTRCENSILVTVTHSRDVASQLDRVAELVDGKLRGEQGGQ